MSDDGALGIVSSAFFVYKELLIVHKIYCNRKNCLYNE